MIEYNLFLLLQIKICNPILTDLELIVCMALSLSAPKWIKMFVLDEADEMLSRGFKDQIYEIFQKLNTSIQVSFNFTPSPIVVGTLVNAGCSAIEMLVFSLKAIGAEL